MKFGFAPCAPLTECLGDEDRAHRQPDLPVSLPFTRVPCEKSSLSPHLALQ